MGLVQIKLLLSQTQQTKSIEKKEAFTWIMFRSATCYFSRRRSIWQADTVINSFNWQVRQSTDLGCQFFHCSFSLLLGVHLNNILVTPKRKTISLHFSALKHQAIQYNTTSLKSATMELCLVFEIQKRIYKNKITSHRKSGWIGNDIKYHISNVIMKNAL